MIFQRIEFTKDFEKQLKKLRPGYKRKFYERLRLFEDDPYAKILRNHILKGKYTGFRSIDITGDLRALYYMDGEKVVIFAFIGTHSQLY